MEQLLIERDTLQEIVDKVRDSLNVDDKMYITEVPSLVEVLTGNLSKDICFTSLDDLVKVGLKGNGIVNLYVNNEGKTPITLSDSFQYVELSSIADKCNIYQIDNADNITELDLRGNAIDKLEFNSYNRITKLILMDNRISKLDLSKCKELKYLHFYNNPICYNKDYKDNLIECMNSLPDRTGKSLGSILLYPWYGLEVLICKDDQDNWMKYPSGHCELLFRENQLYGCVDSKNNITYCKYVSNELVEQGDINDFHSLRKDLEGTVTLKKNWMFGSAIQYVEDEYSHCYHYFTDIGVQDVWETAEKGLGICIGSIDTFYGTAPQWEDMNVKGYVNKIGTSLTPKTSGERKHGDKILSQIVGRGEITYGICPNAQVYPMHNSGGTWAGGIKFLIDNGCNSLTFSMSNIGTSADMRLYLGTFGENNIVTESAGNSGDGLQWTCENRGNKSNTFGNYGGDKGKSNKSNTFFVASLTPMRTPSNFSCSSNDAGVQGTGEFTTENFISHYGEQIAVAATKEVETDKFESTLSFIQGTSMSSPNCNATLALMRVIYGKIYSVLKKGDKCTCFGLRSDFMEYVKANWMDPIDECMSFSTGLGIPCFNYNPISRSHASDFIPASFSYPSSVKIGEPFKVATVVSDNCKEELTPNHDYKYFAQIGKNTLIPIRKNADSFDVYTNTSFSAVRLSGSGSPISYDKNYREMPVSPVVEDFDNSALKIASGSVAASTVNIGDSSYIATESESEDFTVQLHIQFDTDHYNSIVVQVNKDLDKWYNNIGHWYYDAPVYLSKLVGGVPTSAFIGYTKCALERESDTTYRITGVEMPNFMFLTYDDYFDANGDRKDPTDDTLNRLICNLPGYTFGSSSPARFRLNSGDDFVLTITSSSVNGVCVYYNGNLLNKSTTPHTICKLSEMLVPQVPLVNHDARDVLFYDRVLTHREIIDNTILMLNGESN